jgi:hypothetical protein
MIGARTEAALAAAKARGAKLDGPKLAQARKQQPITTLPMSFVR